MVFTSPHMRTIIKPTTNKRGAFGRQTDTGRRPPPKGEDNEPLPHYIRHPRQRNRDHQHHRAQRDRSPQGIQGILQSFCSIIPDIIGIELIREDVGATKQQERDTLAAIMQMVEELGPNSYLATAFAGCFEDAEENIENDFAFSMKERYESSKKDADYFHEAANTFSNDLDKARDEIAAIKAELTDAQNRRIEAEASYNSLVDRTTAAEARAEAAEDEIVTLKAKLYDYITAGA